MKRINSIKQSQTLPGGTSDTPTTGVTIVNNYNYIVTDTDSLILVDTSIPVTITIPESINSNGFHIKDRTGDAFDNPITINTEGSALIENEDEVKIVTAYGSLSFETDGTDWFLV